MQLLMWSVWKVAVDYGGNISSIKSRLLLVESFLMIRDILKYGEMLIKKNEQQRVCSIWARTNGSTYFCRFLMMSYITFSWWMLVAAKGPFGYMCCYCTSVIHSKRCKKSFHVAYISSSVVWSNTFDRYDLMITDPMYIKDRAAFLMWTAM